MDNKSTNQKKNTFFDSLIFNIFSRFLAGEMLVVKQLRNSINLVKKNLSTSVASYSKLRYSTDHEWIMVDGDIATIGISNFAQDTLGDIVYVELPEVELEFEKGDEVGVIESVKSVSNIVAPISGVVTEINEALEDEAELVNRSPLEEGWLLKATIANMDELDELFNEEEYEKFCAEQED